MNVQRDGKYNILHAFPPPQNYPRERKMISVVVPENICQLDSLNNDITVKSEAFVPQLKARQLGFHQVHFNLT